MDFAARVRTAEGGLRQVLKERAEKALSRSIRHLHGLGQDADAIAGALSIDVSEVRRALADDDGGERSSRSPSSPLPACRGAETAAVKHVFMTSGRTALRS